MLFLYTLQHLTVDGICGAALADYAVNEKFFEPIIYFFGLYNLIAFGTQWLFGYILDRKFQFIPYALIISLISLALGTISALGIFNQTVFLGIGNSLFHVAGGSLVLRNYTTYKELGIFVSSGAIGLALGLNQFFSTMTFLILYAIITLIVVRNLRTGIFETTNIFETESNFEGSMQIENVEESHSSKAIFAILSCAALLLGCVVLRGFGGSNNPAQYVMLFPCIFALGKCLGGICCDKFGFKNTIVLIFIISFLALQMNGLTALVILTLAFNMTMPLTLRLVHFCNPKYPGLMFGLAAGCLLPGAFFSESFKVIPQAMVVIQFLSLFVAGYLFKTYKRGSISL